MHQTVSDFVLDRLTTWGIQRIYGYPGDGINGFFGALERAGERFEFIQARHEETAALMASSHAKFSGTPGVCVATSGPGGIHLLNGLYDAKKDHQPVVAIVGQQPRAAVGGDSHQEIDLERLFANVCSAFVGVVNVPAQARPMIDRAFRMALATRSPTCIIMPNDVQELDAVPSPPHVHGNLRTSAAFSRPVIVPRDADLDAAAALLNEGKRPAILIGSGARGAEREVLEVADRLGAGIAKALLGKDVLSDYTPYVTGSVGLLGTAASVHMLADCDTLLMIGTNFPYAEFLPPEGSVKAVQIDIDGRRLGLRYPTDINLEGDSRATLAALLLRLRNAPADTGWRKKIEHRVADWWKLIEKQAAEPANPLNPEHVYTELSKHLPDNAIVTADSGTSAYWYGRNVRLREGMRGSLSGQLASMGVGVPYAIGAKFAHPDRPVIAMVGDGAMQMNGLAELLTVQHYHERWSDQRFVVSVLNNRDLNLVTWEERAMAGDPRYDASQTLPAAHYADIARSMGLHGIRIDHPDQVGDAWDEALNCGKPALLEWMSDPDVPPLPPHISVEQAKHFMFALARGDSERDGVIKESLRQIRDVISH